MKPGSHYLTARFLLFEESLYDEFTGIQTGNGCKGHFRR